jgi:hypothetical protein
MASLKEKLFVIVPMVFFLVSCAFSPFHPTSSDSVAISEESTSSHFSEVTSSELSSSLQEKAEYYRIAPVIASETNEKCPVYNVSFFDGKYSGTVVTTLSQPQECLSYENVCLYYQAFRTLPPNYKPSKSEALKYGKNGRCYSSYYKGDYSGSSDYTVALGNFRNPAGLYLELDIDLTGSYNNGSTITRGTGRVVVVVDGISDYKEEPVCYFTSDHYTDFVEFYNYQGGWSPLFIGAASGKTSPKSTIKRPVPKTVDYVNA